MYHHRRCGGPLSRGAVTAPTATAQSIGPRCERTQSISTALLASAWIVLAHRARQRSEPLVQGMRIGTQQAAVNFGQATLKIREPDLAFGASLRAPAHRVGQLAVGDPIQRRSVAVAELAHHNRVAGAQAVDHPLPEAGVVGHRGVSGLLARPFQT